MSIGIYQLPAELWVKGYMTMGLFFCVGSSFTLAKTVRDNHESRKLINRVTEVKTERMLQDYELKEPCARSVLQHFSASLQSLEDVKYKHLLWSYMPDTQTIADELIERMDLAESEANSDASTSTAFSRH